MARHTAGNEHGGSGEAVRMDACLLLYRALCRLRVLAGRNLKAPGMKEIFEIADAAHNIPCGIAGDFICLLDLKDVSAELEEVMQRYGQQASGRSG
jgi:hypothetical protein